MVHGLPQLKDSKVTCTDCFAGKQHRNAVPKKNKWRASKVLELIHADICGPIDPYPIVGKGTSYASSMIIVVKHGCICCLRSQKPWNVSKASRRWLKRKQKGPLNV